MNSRSTGIAKEARLLLGAWVAVMLMGVVSLVPVASTFAGLNIHGMLESLVPFGAMFGIPLLATLAFGSEFQYRTMAMLLAQPVDRREIWREKMMVSATAVSTAAVVYAFSLHALRAKRAEEWMSVIAIAAVSLAAAPFYTFVARSMIGGLVLNLSGFFVVTVVLDYLAYVVQISPHSGYEAYDRHLQDLPGWFVVAGILVYAGYSAVMTWLGRRAFLRLQAVEGMQAGEAILPASRIFPGFAANWFRCRPHGRILNLVRREFHLLRIVWILGLVCAAMWTAIAFFGLMPTPESDRFLMLIGIAVVGNVVIAVLAGAISLGEEKTWGTHPWHMTLPVSTNLQWVVKLLIALLTSLIWAALVPIAILRVGALIGGPTHGLGDPDIWMMLLYASLLTLAAFWSACVVKGTVRATVWVIPTGLALTFSALTVVWITSLGTGNAMGWYERVGWFYRALGWIVAAIGPMKVSSWMEFLPLRYLFVSGLNFVLMMVVTGIALIQTRRLFAARREETTRTALHALVPIVLATALCVLALNALQVTVMQSYRQEEQVLDETHQAIIAKIGSADKKMEKLTWSDLSRETVLSSGARKWLRNASVTVVQDTPELIELRNGPPAPSTLWSMIPGDHVGPLAGYSAIVHMPNGSECSLKFNRARGTPTKYFGGWIRGTCD